MSARNPGGIVAWEIRSVSMRLLAAVLLVAVLCPPRRASAEERYFALFFAHQTPDTKPEEAHSYVEFIRAEVQPNCPPIVVQRDTISWLPCNAIVRLHALRPEPGHNFTLEESLQLGRGKHIFAWGPYEMTCKAYRFALSRKAHLESGAMMYKAIDVIPGQSRYSANCIHGMAEIDPDARRIGQYNIKYGEYATRQAIRHYVSQGFLINPCLPYDDIYAQLGLEGRCIDRRNDWEPNLVVRILRPRLRCD
jgi:hypothetical protein